MTYVVPSESKNTFKCIQHVLSLYFINIDIQNLVLAHVHQWRDAKILNSIRYKMFLECTRTIQKQFLNKNTVG